jgi:hypothetical protein
MLIKLHKKSVQFTARRRESRTRISNANMRGKCEGIVSASAARHVGRYRQAKIVITNFHAFKRRETTELSKVSRALLQDRGEAPEIVQTEGQVLQRA